MFPTIQAAITAAASGDTILIAPGLYRESVVVPPAQERLRIEGAGPGLTRIHGGGILEIGMRIGGAFTTVVGLTVTRFRLDGIQATSNNNLFENLVLERNGRHGIALQPGALRNVILRVIANAGAGIRLGRSTERIVVQLNEALGNLPDLLDLAPFGSQNRFAANVCQTSSPAGLCGSTDNLLRVPTQFPTIQAAVSAAVQGQVILVDPGVYHESVLIPAGKEAVLIQGAGAGLSILDGDGLRISGFNIQGSSFLTIRGFTIRNYTGSGVEIQTEGNWVHQLDLFNPVTVFGDQNLIHLNQFHSTGILTPLLIPTGTSNYLINNGFDQAVSAIRTDSRSQRTLVWRNVLTAIDTIALELTGPGDLAIENTIDEAHLNAIQTSSAQGLLLRNQIRGIDRSRGILAIEAPEIVTMENSLTLDAQGILALDTGPALIQGNVVNQGVQGIVIATPNTGIVGDENEATNNETGLLVEAAPGNAFRRNTLCDNTLDLDAVLGNTYDLNTCDTSDPPGLCTFGC
jgi:hypothetical protein